MVRASKKRSPINTKKAFEEAKAKTESEKFVQAVLDSTNAEDLLGAAKDVTQEKIANQLTKAGLGIAGALDSVKTQVFAHLEQLEAVRSAVEEQKQVLAGLYDMEVVAIATKDMIDDFVKREADLDRLYQEKLDAWKTKADEESRKFSDKMDELRTTYQRAQDEFAHAQKIAQRDAQDAFEQKVKEEQREWDDRMRDAERGLQARISDVAKRETDAVIAVEKADAMAAKLDAEVDKAHKAGAAAAYAEMNVKMSLAKAEFEKTIAVQDANIKNLDSKVKELLYEKQAAEKAAADAATKVENIAKAAMEAQSGRAALEAAQQMAEKTAGKDKGR